MNKEVYDLAHKIAAKWCYRNQLDIIGAKKSDNYLYVRGFNGGFPHEAATIKLILIAEKSFSCGVLWLSCNYFGRHVRVEMKITKWIFINGLWLQKVAII